MSARDDFVAPFAIEGAPQALSPARGRIARLGATTVDPILNRHAYPRPVAMLLGEAVALAALIGSLLKAEGRLVVQAQGDGPVSLLLAEHRSDGSLRGYARLSEGAREKLSVDGRLPPSALLGDGALVMTLDQGPNTQAHQGVVALAGETLAECAEAYFRDSEQTPTRIRLAVGEMLTADGHAWRAGGALIQRVAADAARGETHADWERAEALFATLSDEELLDPALASERVLYRLFHEDGVRMGETAPLRDHCGCDRDRLAAVLTRFSAEELNDFVEPDGAIHARCQFCARTYLIAPEELAG
ncbi:MAG: Hsp33 family molecular chaperone HslO [Hyphomonadaceae bacterium]